MKSGQLVWQLPTQNNNISQNAFQLSNSELVINENTIFFSNNKNLVFYDNKGAIIFYDENQKILWKNNFYNKSEKKIKPRLNFAVKKNILIVTDDVAKYYAININTGELLWTKTNIVPFNSNIKIKDDVFYVVDYKNILRSISIQDGSEVWNLKTEESLTKSNTKISIVLDKKNIILIILLAMSQL